MLQRIIAALVLALSVLTDFKKAQDGLKAEIASRDQIIKDQQAVIDSDSADDAALELAAQEAKDKQAAAEASLAELNTQISEAAAKADELVAKINSDSENPVNIAPDGSVSTIEGA